MQINNQRMWLLNLIRGALIGSGFILPGISGGALAVVFGLYEPLINFLAHPFKRFRANFFFFLPVAIGGILGVFGLSFAVSYLLGTYEVIVLWFFIGAIVGTIPALWKSAAHRGRSKLDVGIMILAFVVMTMFLKFGTGTMTQLDSSLGAWLLAGALIGLGMVIPGLSPSNFLIYLGLYQGMSDGIKMVNFSVIIPMMLGVVLILVLLSKLMNYLFEIAYAKLFHAVFGVVLASTIMIIPTDYSQISLVGIMVAVILFAGGTMLGWWMSRLEQVVKTKGDDVNGS